MNQNQIDKLLNTFKNNKEIIALYTLSNMQNLYGQKIEEKVLNDIKNIIQKFDQFYNVDYLAFDINNQNTVITFRYADDIVIIIGLLSMKEPVIRLSIKSLTT